MSQCIECSGFVHPRQHGVSCDNCEEWQHRTCNTGISIREYRSAVDNGTSLTFVCKYCRDLLPEREVEDEDMVQNVDDELEYMQVTILDADTELQEYRDMHSTMVEDDAASNSADIGDHFANITQVAAADANPLLESFDLSARSMNVTNEVVDESHTADDSFDVTRGTIHEPTIILETSLTDPGITDSILEPQPVEYEIVESGTIRLCRKLVSSDGYSYTAKGRKTVNQTSRVQWRCSIRNQRTKCGASVNQPDGTKAKYFPGKNAHCHPPDPLVSKRVKIKKQVKETGKQRLFDSANKIVEDELLETIQTEDFDLPKPAALLRSVHRARAKARPDEPKDLQFEINTAHIGDPEFLIGDVRLDNERHLLFATEAQLSVLRRSNRWYMDGTFKILRDPFYQLFSIHSFIKKDDTMKQVPLVYVLMSRRRKSDYVAVLEKIVDVLGGPPEVQGFVMDFEAGMWGAVRNVFPPASLKGCSFHWAQAVLRKVAAIGLKTTYERREGVHGLIRRTLALPFLPSNHVERAFTALKLKATTPELIELFAYVEHQWIDSGVWSIREWSVHRQPVRSNNDVEGWHRRINAKAGRARLQFYVLVPLLLRESHLLGLNTQLVTEHALVRHRQKKYKLVDGRLEDLYDAYDGGDLKTSEYLTEVAKCYVGKIDV